VSPSAHLERTLGAMRGADIDVLLLGREGNARYVSGADRLWLAGSRPFAPGCVVVGETGAVHLLTITDDGVPADIPPERFYPISWNPVNLLNGLAAIPGVAGPRRVGIDGLTPLFEQLLAGFLPDAELVDGETVIRGVRRVKSADDIRAISDAVGTARRARTDAIAAIRPGVTEAELKGLFEERIATMGTTAPAFEGTFCVADKGRPPRVFVSDRAVQAGDLVHVRAGVIRDGWEGLTAGTVAVDGADPAAPPAHAATIARARAGTSVGDLRASGATVEGSGMGHEELADEDQLEPGMVLWIEHFEDPVLVGDTVVVTDGEPAVIG
jgi:Xaa-Pro dipeptidase